MYIIIAVITVPSTITNGMLSLHRKKKTGSEIVDIVNTGHKGLVSSIAFVEITVLPEGQMPKSSEEEPTQEEGCGEQKEDPEPGQVKDGDENVLIKIKHDL